MTVKTDDLVRELYAEYSIDFPQLSYQEFKDICYHPWIKAKKEISKGTMPKMRMKWVGTFEAKPHRVKWELIRLEHRKEVSLFMTTEMYNHYKKILVSYLERCGHEE